MKKSLPFISRYLPDFHVVEQRDGDVRRFPHPDQLPKLLEALNKEFRAGLPDRIAYVDHRSKDYKKIERDLAALMFCSHINRARVDKLRLHALVDRNLVARISIVQQTTERQELGSLHRFKFYAGEDFFPEIYLNGKSVAFADHAIARFSERVPNPIGSDLTNFIDAFFGSPAVVMICNNSPALVYNYNESLIAFPMRQSDSEYFLPTCLTVDVINKLDPMLPPLAYTPHYDPVYKEPKVRNWDTILWELGLLKIWKSKTPMTKEEPSLPDTVSWMQIAYKVKEGLKVQGYGPGSRFVFRDNILGPGTISLPPGKEEERHVALEELKRSDPGFDWVQFDLEQRAANPELYIGVKKPSSS